MKNRNKITKKDFGKKAKIKKHKKSIKMKS